MTIAQCQPNLIGRSFPYISMIYWYGSLSSGTLVITVGIKIKSLETESDNLVKLNSSSLNNLSMKHYVKSVQIRSFFWSAFFCIRTEYRKIRTRKNSVFTHFSRSERNCKYSSVIYFRTISFSIVPVDFFWGGGGRYVGHRRLCSNFCNYSSSLFKNHTKLFINIFPCAFYIFYHTWYIVISFSNINTTLM